MDFYPLHPSTQPTTQKPAPSDASVTATAQQVAQILKKELIDTLLPTASTNHVLHQQNEAILQALAKRISNTAPRDDARLLEKAKAEVAHWQAEVAKMDQIANETMRKLQQKREDKRILKAKYESMHTEAESWRTKYNDLAARAAKGNHTDAEHTAGISMHERAEIQQKLMLGGQAYRKLQELRPVLDDLKAQKSADAATINRLQAEIVKLKADKAEHEVKIAGLHAAQTTLKPEAAQRIRELELEVAAGKEKVRAAATDASAKATKLLACKDMLARADQVLRTCSQLHTTEGQSTEFSEALNETAANLSLFINNMNKP